MTNFQETMGWVHAQDQSEGHESEGVRLGVPLDIEKGVCCLIKEKKPEVSYRLLEMLLDQKLPALVVTRQYPERVRRERGLSDVKILWLSHTPGENFHNPTATASLAKVFQQFIEDNGGEGVILLDGLEFLIINNGFLQTLMFVEHVNEFIMQSRGVVLIPVSPETLEEKELALLERNLKVLESPALKTDLEAREVSKLLDTY
jgi:archaellum biogenesis ATPase FlaH